MSDYLDKIFSEAGLLSRRFDGYTPRTGQIKMTQSVDAAVVVGDHPMVEVPTGIGKSLGYCIPAIYHTLRTKAPPQTNLLSVTITRAEVLFIIVVTFPCHGALDACLSRVAGL